MKQTFMALAFLIGLCFVLVAEPQAQEDSAHSEQQKAAPFESESWPGEGIPVFAAKTTVLRLNGKPSEDSPRIAIACKAGQRIEFDQSRQVTMQSVFLTAKKTVTDLACPDKNIKINAGDTVEYLQYRAEGYGIVRVKGIICEVFVHGKGDFDGLKAPVSQWWVRVVGKDQTPLGWLRVGSGQVQLLPRKF